MTCCQTRELWLLHFHPLQDSCHQCHQWGAARSIRRTSLPQVLVRASFIPCHTSLVLSPFMGICTMRLNHTNVLFCKASSWGWNLWLTGHIVSSAEFSLVSLVYFCLKKLLKSGWSLHMYYWSGMLYVISWLWKTISLSIASAVQWLRQLWQPHVEIEHDSIAYFDHVTTFKVL